MPEPDREHGLRSVDRLEVPDVVWVLPTVADHSASLIRKQPLSFGRHGAVFVLMIARPWKFSSGAFPVIMPIVSTRTAGGASIGKAVKMV